MKKPSVFVVSKMDKVAVSFTIRDGELYVVYTVWFILFCACF